VVVRCSLFFLKNIYILKKKRKEQRKTRGSKMFLTEEDGRREKPKKFGTAAQYTPT
jgi:hypothetical protein